MRVRPALLALLLALPAAAQQPAPPLGWDPARTRVFAAGVLEWESQAFSGFPKKDRRDVELVDALKAAGVPADRVTYLQDAAATREALERELLKALEGTRPGELFVFYYTGHGSQGEGGDASFAPRDGDPERPGSLWPVASVVDAIDAKGKADRVLLIADCCYSGALAAAAAKPGRRAAYAVLASSLRTNVSTGNWTFTECLLAGLRGDGRCDGDGDGLVELDELAAFTEARMAFVEEQLACALASPAFPPDAALARVTAPKAHPRVGEALEVEWKQRWYRAEVLAVDGERVRVRYIGFSADWDEWVPPARCRPFAPPAFAPGTKVQVEWKKTWYPATVKEGRRGLHLVHYDRFSDIWDEWVPPARIRAR